MNPDELDSALGRLLDMAESATARLDRLATEVGQIRSIVEGLRYRASADRNAPDCGKPGALAGATRNPTPGEQAPQAEVFFK